jgi:hypothetical protein
MLTGVSTMDPLAQCGDMWWLLILFIVSNVLENVLVLQLTRSGSALLVQVVAGVQLPISNLFYASRAIMGAALVVPMTSYMWIGLSVVMVGFICYSFMPMECWRKAPVHVVLSEEQDAAEEEHTTEHIRG